MPYDDVPQRLVDGESVPASEIIGYIGSDKDIVVRLTMNVLCMMLVMARNYDGEVMTYQITSYGMSLRESFLVRLEGECPECP